MQKDGTWRTDFNDPSAGTIQRPITLAPCTFNIDDPYTLYAGPIYRNESTGELICDLSSKTYESSNASTSSVQWPTDNFWVVHANNELAFGREDPCSDGGANSGPPGQSKPVSVPGQAVFGFEYVNSDLPCARKLCWPWTPTSFLTVSVRSIKARFRSYRLACKPIVARAPSRSHILTIPYTRTF